jgi:hypothetical protein
LPKAQVVREFGVPQAYSEDAGIVGELDFEVALCGFMLFGGFGDVVEVHDTAHEGKVAGAGLEGADVCFFVVELGL